MNQKFDLHDKVAIVTGASSGLGVQFAKALGSQGTKLMLVARRENKLRKVKEELNNNGIESDYFTVDVSKEEEVKRAVDEILDKYGKVDILVNNAGVASVEPIENHKLKEWQKVIDINLTGAFLFTKYTGKVMLKQNYGKIINISSIYGKLGNNFLTASSYHASKGALDAFTKAVAVEWADKNINVNAIAPGFFLTEMTEEFAKTKEFDEYIKNRCPKERMGVKSELAGAITLLASDASDYITGQVLYVDGGWTAV